MTWTDPAPGISEAQGIASALRVEQITPEDPYRWRIVLSLGRPESLSLYGEYRGTMHGARTEALAHLHGIGERLSRDAAALAASMTTKRVEMAPAPEVGG